MNADVSGATGYRNCQLVASTICRICSPTKYGEVGLDNAAANIARMRLVCGYGLSLGPSSPFLKMGVAMTPGSMIATLTLNARTSWARHSLKASSAHLDAE